MPDAPLISQELLVEGCWQFVAPLERAGLVRFWPGGELRAGERVLRAPRWEIDGTAVVLKDDNGATVYRFTDVRYEGDDPVLIGHSPAQPRTECRLRRWPWDARPNHSKTRVALAESIEKFGWTVGDHSYGAPSVAEKRLCKLHIGKYCAFAGSVQIALGDHRSDIVSTYPFATIHKYWPSTPSRFQDHVTRGDVVIGNDVWIGTRAFIGSGVTIGDGAVIGANAVVTRDVRPYAIVVGNPGKEVRRRFDDETVDSLLSIAWWDWPDERVDRFVPLILSDDIGAFIAAARAEG